MLVGVVFAVGPAAILSPMTGWSVSAWIWIIFGYYFLATILPIQAIMGKVYPLFSVALIIMVMGILGVMLLAPFADSMPAWMHLPRMEVLPDLDFFHNRHPADFPLFPVMFITIACGAVSGFHATQSPLMARCLKTEREGLPVFGGAMITEGIIAFIWAAAALTFYGSPEALGGATANGKAPALAIQTISESWMGSVGSILVMIGVVILPISTGDGALRVTRLMIADSFKLSQEQLSRRLMIAIPLFAAAIAVSSMDYAVIWQYFGWANQLLAAATLWAVSIYLRSKKRCYWPAAAPAAFLSLVVFQYLFSSPEMCGFSEEASLIASTLLTAVIGVLCLFRGSGLEKAEEPSL
ncbi:carbon starvation CstA family protein [Akkermansia muciniphila]|uniref:carbon starvation CstA family protein n=1 Tax=Akkermansia muciniphila TaxID=239935 RepID=UPI00319E9F57